MDIVNYFETHNEPFKYSDEGAVWYGDEKDRPEIEQDLQLYQSKFYNENNPVKKQKIWSEMFSLIQKYSKSLILKKRKGKKYVDPDEIDDQATQTALAFMSQYIYRPGFRCGASFAGMINPKILETLFKHSQEDQNYSLNSIIGDSNNEFQEMQSRLEFKALYNNDIGIPEDDFFNKVDLKEIIENLLKEFDSLVPNEIIKFKLRVYLLLLLRKPKNKHIVPVFLKYICNKKELDLLQLFELELFKVLKNEE